MPGLLAALAGARPAAAQRVELRAGATWSSALAHDPIGGGASATTLRPALAPALALAGLLPLRPRLELELSGGAARSRLEGEDGSGSWSAQSVTVGQALLGLRWSVPGRPYLRAAMGAVRYFSPAQGIFADGSGVRPALEAGGGWVRPLGRFQAGAELAVQAHTFLTQTLSAEHANAGRVARATLLLTLARGVAR